MAPSQAPHSSASPPDPHLPNHPPRRLERVPLFTHRLGTAGPSLHPTHTPLCTQRCPLDTLPYLWELRLPTGPAQLQQHGPDGNLLATDHAFTLQPLRPNKHTTESPSQAPTGGTVGSRRASQQPRHRGNVPVSAALRLRRRQPGLDWGPGCERLSQ